MKVKEAIELINNSDNCYSLWDAQNLLKGCKFMNRQNYDSHRWYIMATDIYEVDDGYIGVRGVAELKSEMMDFSDCDEYCEAEEYEAEQTITYIHKTKKIMTREKEILSAARDYIGRVTLSSPSYVIHFENGAKWADEHHVNVWHDASDMPKAGEWVLVRFRDDGYDTFVQRITCKDIWCAWCKSNNITHWAYVSDMLPKGGEKLNMNK